MYNNLYDLILVLYDLKLLYNIALWSLKSKARCEEKAQDDYEGDLSRLFDVARASVKCSTATQLLTLHQGPSTITAITTTTTTTTNNNDNNENDDTTTITTTNTITNTTTASAKTAGMNTQIQA